MRGGARSAALRWGPGHRRVAGRTARSPFWRGLLQRLIPRGRLRGGLLLLAGMLVLAGLFTLYNQPMFKVAQVRVRGVQALAADQVMAAARLEGQHILELSDQRVMSTLATLPRVKRVRVERIFPNAVELVVEERQPWALWQLGGTFYVLDGEGVVLEARAQPLPGLPVVVASGSGTLKPGSRVSPEPVKLALALTTALPAQLRVNVRRFEYSEQGGLLAVTDGGWQARFGSSEDLEYKLATLKAIVETARARGVSFSAVDLRFGARPFIR